MLIPNSRILRAMVVKKMVRENERKLVKKLASEFAASSQNSKVGGSSGHRQMVARVNIGQEEAAILCRTLSGSTCDNPGILGNEVLPNSV